MAKEKYRLQTVLEIREKAKKDAAQIVAVRRQQLAAAEAELERCQQAVQANLKRQRNQQTLMFSEMDGGAQIKQISAYRTHLADLREQELDLRAAVVKQELVVEKAQAEVEKALEFLAEATKEMKVIEKHKETWRINLKKESERKEQKLNDEIGAILYQTQIDRDGNRQK